MLAITEDDVFNVVPYVFVAVGLVLVVFARPIARLGQLNDDPHRSKVVEAVWVAAGARRGRAWLWLLTYLNVVIGLVFVGLGIAGVAGYLSE